MRTRVEHVTATLTLYLPESGHHLNGHHADCRCESCRPDIWRLTTTAATAAQGWDVTWSTPTTTAAQG